MSNEAIFHNFETEVLCSYRGENYCVRDNGAVLRWAREGKRQRPLDETWTFGRPSPNNGYMGISAHKIHRIVATAFHGEPPTKMHVVDHIDTNRRNNRPQNLRWVTKLENILLNPISAKRVKYLYGSIDEFLADPRNPKNGSPTPDFEWMRTVSLTEAEQSRKRMLAWAQSERPSSGGTLDDWVFGHTVTPVEKTIEEIIISKTPGSVQRNWKVPAYFPLCPGTLEDMPIATYLRRLKKGVVAVITPFDETKVGKTAMSLDGTTLFILGDHGDVAIKQWSLAQVTFEDDNFVHESLGTFFTRDGAEKEFTLAQGLLWEGGETFDDYC